jgi:hypothetical protein
MVKPPLRRLGNQSSIMGILRHGAVRMQHAVLPFLKGQHHCPIWNSLLAVFLLVVLS